MVSNSVAEILHQTIKGSRLTVIDGGHVLEMEKPAEVAGLVTGILDEAGRRWNAANVLQGSQIRIKMMSWKTSISVVIVIPKEE